jgi:ABC-type multidrug transport system fused ATPase/permease subunit
MLIKSIIKDYIKKNSSNVILYILSCSFENIVKVLLTSKIYSSFLKKDIVISDAFKNVICIWVLKFILSYIKSYLESIIIPDFVFYMRDRLFSDYLKINELSFNDVNVSTDVRQIIDFTKLFKDLFIWIADSIIPLSILILCMNGYFLYSYPAVGVVNIIGTIVSFHIIKYNYKNILKSSLDREEMSLKIVEELDEKFNNMMNIFLNNKTKDSIEENNSIERAYIKHYRQQYRDLEKFSNSVKTCNYIFAAISLFALYKNTTPDLFVNVLLIYTFYMQTFETITEEIPRYMVLITNIKHIDNYLQKKIYNRLDKKLDDYTNNLDDYKGNISFNNVSFKYEKIDTSYRSEDDTNNENKENKENNENVLNNLNLIINSGERLAVFAKSGSGKSTLMKLLLGFYNPQEGHILLDGKNINSINPYEIRKNINYINQRTLLFNDTILNNMKYGNNKSDDDVMNLLKKYNLLYIFKDCKKSPDTCLNSMVETNGTNISLGMQKIIFLVRGILRNSSVYVLDEPLTSIDPSTRQSIIDMIDKETKGKTLIIITHDNEIEKILSKKVNLSDIQNALKN